MLIRINNPKGRVPILSEKQLPVNYAQTATNCEFRRGRWEPIADDPTPSGAFWLGPGNAIAESIYTIGNKWIPWYGVDVDVVETPVYNEDDRFLYSGDGYPKQSMPAWVTTKNPPTTTRRLGVIAPDGVAEIPFTSGGTTEIVAGDKITGASSEATADVLSVSLTSGSWAAGDAAGTLYVDILSGTWTNGETIYIYGETTDVATAGTIDTKNEPLKVTIQSVGNGRVIESVSYLYVGVTAWGEISGVSASSPVEDIEGDEYVKLSDFVQNSLAITGNDITHFYVYRATIAASGERTWNMIKVRPDLATNDAVYKIAVADFTTDLFDCNDSQDGLNYEIGDPIPSLYWTHPPSTLKGLCQYQNGIIAGFDGQRVYLSERGYYYAFSELNIVEVNYDIVGIAPFNDALIVVTTGYPYLITGNDPAGVVVKKIENLAPCVAKKSIFPTPNGVFWATDEGLFSCDGYRAVNITEKLYTPGQWDALGPENLMGFVWKGYYLGFFIGDYVGIKIPLNTLDYIVDFTIGPSYTFECGCISPDNDALYILIDTGMNLIKDMFSSESTYKTMTWKSGKIQTRPTNIAVARIISSQFANDNYKSIDFSLWAHDGTLGVPAAGNVVGYWTADTDNAYYLFDYSGSDNDAQLNGSPTRENGVSGNCINFPNAAASYADAGSSDELKFGLNDFSVNFWVKYNTGVTQQRWTIGKGKPYEGAGPGWGIRNVTTADPVVPELYVSDGTDAPANHKGSFGNLTRGTWYMVTFTVDRTADTITLYLDAVSVDTIDISGIGTFENTFSLLLGAGNNDTTNTGDLQMDEIIIFDKKLKQSEITDLHDNPEIKSGLKVNAQAISSTEPFWLPSGFQATEWEVQISGSIDVDAIMLAHSPEELTPNV